MKIYVASSWRNNFQPHIVDALRGIGHEVYDFKNPAPGNNGFHWSEIDPNWERWQAEEYLIALAHPISEAGFKSDWDAMQWSDVGVLVLPCGRSAHLEAGYFVGAGKPLYIVLGDENPVIPELMYKMATLIFPGLASLMDFLEPPATGHPSSPEADQEAVARVEAGHSSSCARPRRTPLWKFQPFRG